VLVGAGDVGVGSCCSGAIVGEGDGVRLVFVCGEELEPAGRRGRRGAPPQSSAEAVSARRAPMLCATPL